MLCPKGQAASRVFLTYYLEGIELSIYADFPYLRVCIIPSPNVTNEFDLGSRSATVRLKLGPTDSGQWEGRRGRIRGRHSSSVADAID